MAIWLWPLWPLWPLWLWPYGDGAMAMALWRWRNGYGAIAMSQWRYSYSTLSQMLDFFKCNNIFAGF
jgi:hypothetical protein